ncbi:MAG: phospholipid carrier-dependent glycosyltransferase [Candidatus Yanofskybacteria bacterium]|nr:phospholipid carrier-dependent glycosyltransferase [Candidatus Yanofskybacteria bacterium]
MHIIAQIKRFGKYAPWAVLALSILVHALFFGHPNEIVFDEVHFGKFLSAYFTHQYYFDIHPPLGKLILAGWGWLWGFQPGFSFTNIGDAYPDHFALMLRFLPTLAGTLLPLVLYGIARQLRFSRTAALLVGVLVALDNALLVQSRLILLDSFLLLFGFSAVWCYLRAIDAPPARIGAWLSAAGIFGGMAMSIKWTGATFLALIVIVELPRLWKMRRSGFRIPVTSALTLLMLPVIVYTAIFIAHFLLLTRTGTGDAFMSARFQHDLIGSTFAADTSLAPLSPLEKTIELNIEMYRSNQRLTASHPYASMWYTWPFMDRSIYYWVDGTSRIYLLGNPFIWWASTIAVFAVIANVLFTHPRKTPRVLFVLLGAWLMNLLPFIGIHRVMFLYHYFPGLLWAILMLGYLVDRSRHRVHIAGALVLVALIGFVYFAPLSYGLPLSDAAYNARTWFNSWR